MDIPGTCPVCHQAVSAEYYFCPNCGTNLRPVPLSTSPESQLALYAFSIILPFVAYLFITRWKGLKYFRSSDPKARMMGTIAIALLLLSSVVGIYYTYVWTQEAIQSSVAQLNQDMSI